MNESRAVKVLVVEDDEQSRRLLVEVLGDQGYDVVDVDSGEKALEALRGAEASFDLMVLDIQMPGMDGMAVARTVRRNLRHRDLPILAVTALAHLSDAAQILRAGCDAYLSKPISNEELRATVARLLEDGRTGASLHAFTDALRRATAFEVCRSEDGQFYFVLHAEHNEVVATSEMYDRKELALNAIEVVKRIAAEAPISDTISE